MYPRGIKACTKNLLGGLAVFEDRDGLCVVGMGEHIDQRNAEQAIAAIEQLV